MREEYGSGEVSDAGDDVEWDVREGYGSGEVSDEESGDESALESDDGSALAGGAPAPPAPPLGASLPMGAPCTGLGRPPCPVRGYSNR